MSSSQKEKDQSPLNNTEVQSPFDKIDLSIFKDHIEQNFLEKLSSPHMQNIEKLIVLAKPCLHQLNYITKFDKIKQKKIEKIEILGEMISETYEKTPLIIYIIPQLIIIIIVQVIKNII